MIVRFWIVSFLPALIEPHRHAEGEMRASTGSCAANACWWSVSGAPGRGGAAVRGRAAPSVVTVTDKRDARRAGRLAGAAGRASRVELGGHARDDLHAAPTLIVLSPGRAEIPELRAARAAGVPVTGEIELASRFVRGTLIAHHRHQRQDHDHDPLAAPCSRATGRPTFVGGNLGEPLAEAVDTPGRPRRAASGRRGVELPARDGDDLPAAGRGAAQHHAPITSIAIPACDAYVAAKERIFAAQTAGRLRGRQRRRSLARARQPAAWAGAPLGFSSSREVARGGVPGSSSEIAVRDAPGRARSSATRATSSRLVGPPQPRERAGRVLLRAPARGARPPRRCAALRAVPAAAAPDGAGAARWTASPTTTTRRAPTWARWSRRWTGFPRPVVLIAGGRDKGGDYAPLRRRARRRCARAVVLIGEAADKIAAGARRRGLPGRARARDWTRRSARPRAPRPGRATRWCCRRPAPASTCSGTTSTAARCSARGAWLALGGRRNDERARATERPGPVRRPAAPPPRAIDLCAARRRRCCSWAAAS